ncbi:hypothetical protein D3C71_1987000 [compost metagenome]
MQESPVSQFGCFFHDRQFLSVLEDAQLFYHTAQRNKRHRLQFALVRTEGGKHHLLFFKSKPIDVLLLQQALDGSSDRCTMVHNFKPGRLFGRLCQIAEVR